MSSGQTRPKWRHLDIMHSPVFGKITHRMDLIPTFKHVDGEVMIWACFVAAGAGHLSVIELTRTQIYEKV